MNRNLRSRFPLSARFAVEQLEDRAVPATFTAGTFTFEQNSTPDVIAALPAGTYDGAIVTGTPTAATGTVTGFPDTTTGFNSALALGSLVDPTSPPRALQLDQTTTRSGVLLSFSGGKGLANAAGDDLVIYETEPGTGAGVLPEAFMLQVRNAATGAWSSWYYEPADTAAAITLGGSPATLFATAIDLSNLGLANGTIIDAVRVVNMTSADRLVSSSGVGTVTPEAGTGGFAPSGGTLGLSSSFSPEILYAGAFNALTNPLVDVTVTKTDNATSVNAGGSVTYTIVVSNTGANAATGTTLTDVMPSGLTNVSYTSTVTGGATGNTASGTVANGGTLTETLSLPAGSTVTYTVTGTLSGTATGTLSNTASATVSSSFTDTNTANNTATDTSAIVPLVDLQVTKTDGQTVVAAGQTLTYTVVVTNAGQNAVTGATLADAIPAALTNVSYTSTATGGATGNTASGTIAAGGSLNQTLNLPAGSTVTYTVTGTVAAGTAVGTSIGNTATITTPSGTTDNLTSNNTATDTDTVVPLVDVSVTKTDNVSSVSAGQTVTYTIVASNLGATAVTGAVLTDAFPAALTNVSYTSTVTGGATGNTASGTVANGGTLTQTLNLPVGATVTYTVTATVAAGTTGAVTNTATIATPSGVTDNRITNNTATDTDTVPGGTVDLRVTKTDNQKFVVNNLSTTYTIVVSNVGSTAAFGVNVLDALPAELTGATWTSTATGGATGNTASGTGSINETINLPVGASVTYTLTATVSGSGRGGLTNTVTVTPATGVTDTNPADNTASDRDTVLPKPVPAYGRQFAVGADAGANGHVKSYNPDGTERFSFIAFAGFNGGVRVATGDVNGDGINDIIVGAGFGAGNGHIKVFDGDTGALISSFFSFQGFLGGVNVAVGDVNGDGFGDIIVSSGFGAGHVKVFDGSNGALLASFLAYPGFTGGVTVAAADLNGDGKADIITGVAGGGPAHVKAFALDANNQPVTLLSFITLPGYTGGISVAAGDLRGNDGLAEIVVAPLSGGANGLVQILSGTTGSLIQSFTPSFPGPDRGLQVAVADANNDGTLDIIVAGGPGRGSRLRAYNGLTLAALEDITAFAGFQGGVFVG